METLANARRNPRRVWFIVGILLALFLFVGGFMGGRAMAYGPTKGPQHHTTCRYNAAHQLLSGSPSYCKQSNWSCVGTDGACVNGKEKVTYPSNCPQKSKVLNCAVSGQCPSGEHHVLNNGYEQCVKTAYNCAAASTPDGCSGTCHEGYFIPHTFCPGGVYNGGHAVVSGGKKLAYTSACTAGCSAPPAGCTPDGSLTLHFLGCVGNGIGKFDRTNSCGSVMSTSTGAATRCDTGSSNPPGNGGGSSGNGGGSGGGSSGGNGNPPPACTPSSHKTYGADEWTGCSAKGVETGYQPYTVYHSCPSYTSTGTRSVEQHTSTTCQLTIDHQCAYGQPGYAQQRTCLTSPLGGVTDCGNWSSPYYDPYDCPIPTPIGTY